MTAEFAEPNSQPPDLVESAEQARHLYLVEPLVAEPRVEVSRFNLDGTERLNYDSPGMIATYAAIDNARECFALKYGRRKV